MEAAHFPKGPSPTGLTILDRLPKKKKNTLKATKLTSYINFEEQDRENTMQTKRKMEMKKDNPNKRTA